MAVIKIVNFGGLVPKAAEDALPDNAAQKAENLLPTTTEFRPIATDTTVISDTEVTNPATLFRLQRNSDGSLNTNFSSLSKWIVAAGPRSYVKAPNDDDLTDRHVYTFDDGSAAPRVVDAEGDDRLLGVPKPATAPTVTLVASDEFTPEERTTEISAVKAQVATLIRAHLQPVWRGAPEPGDDTEGYVNLQDEGTADATQARQARVYRTSSMNGAKNGAITETYTGIGPEAFQWVWDPLVKPFWATSNESSPAWQDGAEGEYYDHICITYHAYGLTYQLDEAGLAEALAEIPMPGGEEDEKFFTEDEIEGADGIVSRLAAYTNPNGAAAKAKLDALARKVEQLRVALDQGTAGALLVQRQAFWESEAVEDFIDAAVANAAEAIWNEAQRAALYTDIVSGGS